MLPFWVIFILIFTEKFCVGPFMTYLCVFRNMYNIIGAFEKKDPQTIRRVSSIKFIPSAGPSTS